MTVKTILKAIDAESERIIENARNAKTGKNPLAATLELKLNKLTMYLPQMISLMNILGDLYDFQEIEPRITRLLDKTTAYFLEIDTYIKEVSDKHTREIQEYNKRKGA